MFSLNTAIFCFVLFANQTTSLKELPKVDDNNILATEAAIRHTVNTLFHSLNLKRLKSKPRIKEYSTVYNHLISFTLQDYNNLREIAKLTRVERNKTNNETKIFMAVINELLNEDNDVEKTYFPHRDDESVVEYVDQFLKKLKDFKEQYGVNDKALHIKEDVYQALQDNDVVFYNYTMDKVDVSEFGDSDTILDESEFWKPEMETRRIYRGDKTKIKYFPFMASIQIFNKFHCAGCIIKSDLIITASSCLQLAWNNRFFRENPAFLSVRVGSNFYNGGGENIPVLEVYFHPKYDPQSLHNNLCLLRLVRRLNFRKRQRKIKKIEFDTQPSSLPMTTDGITIVGWGARGSSNIVMNPWENTLAFAVLDIYPLRECQDIYSKQYVTYKNFCAGFFSKGGGACNRDVGGPGIVGGKLTGIVSFGSPVCGTPDAPTVFTKLGFYTDWIEEIVEMDIPYRMQKTTEKQTMGFTIGQYYQPAKTTFKIPPISGKMKPVPISEVDALRMLNNEKLFKEFLSTMFSDKDAAEYQDLLQDLGKQLLQPKEMEAMEADATGIIKSTDLPQIETFMETTPYGPLFATEIGAVDPDEQKDSNNEEDSTKQIDVDRAFDIKVAENEIVTDNIIPNNEVIATVNEKAQELVAVDQNMEGLNAIEKHLEGLVEIDKQIDELININKGKDDYKQLNSATTEIVRINKEKAFEKDLVNLIDDIDLKEIIDTMPSVEEDKLALDENVIKLFHEKEKQEKKAKVNDSILTLLYLSSSEKAAKSMNPQEEYSLIQDEVEEDDDDDDDDDDEDDDNNNVERKGMSIEVEAFKDMTYRHGDNATNIFDKLTREEIDKLLAKHLDHLQPNVW